MAKTINNLHANRKKFAYFIQLLDARAPLSSCYTTLKVPPHKLIYVITKTDLVSANDLKKIKSYYQAQNSSVIRVHQNDVVFLKKHLIELSKKSNNFTIAAIFGVPNVGKSTLINQIIAKKSNQAYNLPGLTKQLKINQITLKLFLCDTPGLLFPKYVSETQAYHLALIGSIAAKLLPLSEIVSYAIKFLHNNYFFLWEKNKMMIEKNDSFVKICNIIKNRYHYVNDQQFYEGFYYQLIHTKNYLVCWDIVQIKNEK